MRLGARGPERRGLGTPVAEGGDSMSLPLPQGNGHDVSQSQEQSVFPGFLASATSPWSAPTTETGRLTCGVQTSQTSTRVVVTFDPEAFLFLRLVEPLPSPF